MSYRLESSDSKRRAAVGPSTRINGGWYIIRSACAAGFNGGHTITENDEWFDAELPTLDAALSAARKWITDGSR